MFITAYARRNLFTAIWCLRDDFIYADTDSVKFRHYEKHKAYFDHYNEIEKRKLALACARHGIPLEDVSPKTIQGKVKTIGLWDDDGHYARFKTLGAKRYLAEYDDGHLLLTIAGVSKKAGLDYLLYRYKTNDRIFKAFTRDLEFPSSYAYKDKEGKKTIRCATGKQTCIFLDEGYEGTLVDYCGIPCGYKEDSGMYMESASYNLTMFQAYIDYAMGVQEVKIG